MAALDTGTIFSPKQVSNHHTTQSESSGAGGAAVFKKDCVFTVLFFQIISRRMTV